MNKLRIIYPHEFYPHWFTEMIWQLYLLRSPLNSTIFPYKSLSFVLYFQSIFYRSSFTLSIYLFCIFIFVIPAFPNLSCSSHLLVYLYIYAVILGSWCNKALTCSLFFLFIHSLFWLLHKMSSTLSSLFQSFLLRSLYTCYIILTSFSHFFLTSWFPWFIFLCIFSFFCKSLHLFFYSLLLLYVIVSVG